MAQIKSINAEFTVRHHYPVLFDYDVFNCNNPLLRDLLANDNAQRLVLVYIDSGVHHGNPQLQGQICDYFDRHHTQLKLLAPPLVIEGGEAAKTQQQIEQRYHQLLEYQVDRHCCVIAIGGGAVLDAVGYACTTFHRGVNLVRMPSTVLAQNDAGVGVKNGFNLADKKNLIGTFSPPLAVVNDAALLEHLAERDKRAGLAEAVKVAAIRDAEFFEWLEQNAEQLSQFEQQTSQYAIARCAELHVKQITKAGDPFETGSARPLDYGHWSAHKLEAMANYTIRHGEAVAIGMALDARYAANVGFLPMAEADRLIALLRQLGFSLWHEQLASLDENGLPLVLSGIEDFRQHLGGALCITLVAKMGLGEEVNVINQEAMIEALAWLEGHVKDGHIPKDNVNEC